MFMRKILSIVTLALMFATVCANAYEIDTDSFVTIINNPEECVRKIHTGKLYLNPASIRLSEDHYFIELADDIALPIPALFEDAEGLFVTYHASMTYWQCIKCQRSYTSKPEKCGKCNGTIFRRVTVP
jgi:hypothetical protein